MTAEESDVLRQVGALVEASHPGRSAADVAKEAGVNVKTLRALELGQKWPWASSQKAIEGALGLSPGTLELWRRDPRARELAARGGQAGNPHTAGSPPVETPAVDGIPGQELVRLGYVALIHDRIRGLPSEDIAELWEHVNALGRRRYPDWDKRFDDGGTDLAWNRRPVYFEPLDPKTKDEVDAAARSWRENES